MGTHGLTHGLTYGAYNPYYTLPVVKAAEAEVKAVDAEEKKTVVPLGHYPINYGHSGYLPYTHPVVTKKVVKAVDGEEKAVVAPYALPYGGLYNYGYGYSGYPAVHSVAGRTIGSPLHYYGKRSADAVAEPEANADADAAADPWLTYGYSGYGHGLYRPYGYRAHYGGHLGYGYGGYRSYGYPYYG